MTGRCYRCATKFGVFKKEIACSKCGYGFCKKCLPHVATVSPGTEAVPVCGKCFQVISNPSAKPESEGSKYDELPENFKKRVAALQAKEESQGKPSTGNTRSGSQAAPSGSAADKDMALRLQKLKEDRKKEKGPVASFEEMEERLRILKGTPGKTERGQTNPAHQPPETRTSQEQSQDLMTQMQDEVRLDNQLAGKATSAEEAPGDDNIDPSTLSPEDEAKKLEEEVKNLMDETKRELKAAETGRTGDAAMEERLAKLHGMDLQTYRDKGRIQLEQMTEDESRKMYIAKLLEESRLDERMEKDGYSKLVKDSTAHYMDKTTSIDADELPWCCICNEDALVRCHDCDGDLYCKTCFREGHDGFDMKYHKTSKYRAPKDVHT